MGHPSKGGPCMKQMPVTNLLPVEQKIAGQGRFLLTRWRKQHHHCDRILFGRVCSTAASIKFAESRISSLPRFSVLQ